MLTLFSLHWSHFVEKVWWALDYKGLSWHRVEVDAFSKRPIRKLGVRDPLVPTLHDQPHGKVVTNSSTILEYVEDAYPDAPHLFPQTGEQRDEMRAFMHWLDSTLGPWARRLGYAEVIRQRPQLLAQLFLPRTAGGLFTWPLMRHAGGAFVALVLMQRFNMHHNFRDGLYHKVDRVLAQLSERLGGRDYFFGEQLSAADITVASLLRPLRVVPYFFDNPAYRPLFAWQENLFDRYRRPAYAYEGAVALRAAGRDRRARPALPPLPDVDVGDAELRSWTGKKPVNDQRPVQLSRLPLLFGHYLKMRHFSRW